MGTLFFSWGRIFLFCDVMKHFRILLISKRVIINHFRSFSFHFLSHKKPGSWMTKSNTLNSEMCFSNPKSFTTQNNCQNKLAQLWIQCSDLNVLPPTGLLQLLTNNIRSRPDVRVTCRRTKYPLYEIASVIWRAHRARAKYEDCSICGVGGGGGACYPPTPCREG